jgi:hypothetical protein
LHDARSLRDLLIGLRGRQVRLHREHGDPYTGILVGIDEVPDRQPMESALVSIVIEDSSQVKVLALSTLRGGEILDDAATSDLSFFLETATGQETHRNVDIHLTPGDHDLAVSYIAPAPTWRVSYRLITDEVSAEGKGAALLQGWGIFDNRLGEDLQAVQLSLVAGMPISFVYDLYTPSRRSARWCRRSPAWPPVPLASKVPSRLSEWIRREKPLFRSRNGSDAGDGSGSRC